MKKSTLLFGLISLFFIGCNSGGSGVGDKYAEVSKKNNVVVPNN